MQATRENVARCGRQTDGPTGDREVIPTCMLPYNGEKILRVFLLCINDMVICRKKGLDVSPARCYLSLKKINSYFLLTFQTELQQYQSKCPYSSVLNVLTTMKLPAHRL